MKVAQVIIRYEVVFEDNGEDDLKTQAMELIVEEISLPPGVCSIEIVNVKDQE